jgi:hypothetical protein
MNHYLSSENEEDYTKRELDFGWSISIDKKTDDSVII